MPTECLEFTYRVQLPVLVWIQEAADAKEDPVISAVVEDVPVSLRVCKQLAGTTTSTVRGIRQSPASHIEIIIKAQVKLRDESDPHLFSDLFSILRHYDEIAFTAANRFVDLFRYELEVPLLRNFERLSFSTPSVYHENGKPFIHKGGERVHIKMPAQQSILDIRSGHRLSQALSLGILPPPVERQLLLEAKDAIAESSIPRAVILLAVAAESAAREQLFGGSETAAALFRYLEDKGRISLPIPHLVSDATKAAFGRSFRSDNKEAWRRLDELFQARNKAVHRGEASFRNAQGELQSVTLDLLSDWEEAVTSFFSWLEEVGARLRRHSDHPD